MNKYDKLMRVDFNPLEGDIPTPESCAELMTKLIGEDYFKSDSTTFLEPCCGRGGILYPIIQTFRAHGHSIKNIEPRVKSGDISSMYYNNLKTPSGLGSYNFKIFKGDSLKIDLLAMNNNDEFDLAGYNPPYGTGQNPLHLMFFETIYKVAKRQLVLHPGTFLLRPEYGGKEGGDVWLREKRIDDIITNTKSSFTWLNGSEIFDGADFTYPIVISDIDKTKPNDQKYEIYDTVSGKTFVFNSTRDINMMSDSPAYFSARDKIRAATKEDGTNFSTIPEMAVQGDKKWSVQYSGARGNKTSKGYKGYYNPDFFTIIPADKVPNDKAVDHKYQEWRTIWFDTEEEALNFIEYLKTYFFRFCLGLNKTSRDIMNRHVKWCPWLGDYKTKWTDELLFEKFDITKEEQKIIYDSLPDYYGIAKGN